MNRTLAESALLAKARRGEPISVDDKLSVVTSVMDVEWFARGMQAQGLLTREVEAACARRKVELARGAA